MACAIGLSRILREDRATKDGYKVWKRKCYGEHHRDGSAHDDALQCEEDGNRKDKLTIPGGSLDRLLMELTLVRAEKRKTPTLGSGIRFLPHVGVVSNYCSCRNLRESSSCRAGNP